MLLARASRAKGGADPETVANLKVDYEVLAVRDFVNLRLTKFGPITEDHAATIIAAVNAHIGDEK
jgi:hypothetical protein